MHLMNISGILLITKLGGYLFDEWMFTGPFFLAGIVHVIAAALSLAVVLIEVWERRRRKPDETEVVGGTEQPAPE